MARTIIHACAPECAQADEREARGDEQLLYEAHHEHLLRSVGGAVIGDRALVEDACARAWERLLVCQPDRGEHLFAWLRRVAIHEAWALARRDLREVEPAHPDRDWVDAQRSAAADRTERAERTERALEALQALAGLGERERRYMALRVVGWSYKEIAAGCGVTYTNVNRHLARAHAKLRTIAAETDAASRTHRASRKTIGGRR